MLRLYFIRKLFLIVIGLTIAFLELNAQSIDQRAIATSGSQSTISWTVGEPFITTIGNVSKITQGFHQGFIINTSYHAEEQIVKISVYPNPTTDYIKISNLEKEPLTYSLYNTQGLLVKKGEFYDTHNSFSVQTLLTGNYFLSIRAANKSIYTTKIIKI